MEHLQSYFHFAAADLLKIIDELTAGTLLEPPSSELCPGAAAADWAAEQRHWQQQRSGDSLF